MLTPPITVSRLLVRWASLCPCVLRPGTSLLTPGQLIRPRGEAAVQLTAERGQAAQRGTPDLSAATALRARPDISPAHARLYATATALAFTFSLRTRRSSCGGRVTSRRHTGQDRRSQKAGRQRFSNKLRREARPLPRRARARSSRGARPPSQGAAPPFPGSRAPSGSPHRLGVEHLDRS